MISIVIPARNDDKNTGLLPALLQMAGLGLEILVVDWGSETPLVLPSFVKRAYVRPAIADQYNRDSKYNLPAASNVGLRRASGDYVFYMGNDTYGTRELFDYVRTEARPDTLYVIPRRHIASPETMDQFKQSGISRYWGASGSWVASRELWHTMRGFDQRWIYYGFMDREIVWRCQLKGYDVVKLPYELSVYHIDHPRCWMRTHGVENEKVYTREELKPTTWIVNDDNWGLANESIETA
jgi:glycosyltransferase involved in cell wall biosynthesis